MTNPKPTTLAGVLSVLALIIIITLTARTLRLGRSRSLIKDHLVETPEYIRPLPSVTIEVSGALLERGRLAISDAIACANRNNGFAIIVDKSAYSLLVYDSDTLAATFPVELGGDPVNPKERLGDSRTPEGAYTVTWRRDLGETTFHRALLIDYPNHNDRRAGRTGSHIEIHGYGTGLRPHEGGSNWTDGCIALSNADIDSLFTIGDGNRRIGNGTPVAIVYAGSLPDARYAVRDP